MADRREVARIIVGEVVSPDTAIGRVLTGTVERMVDSLEPGEKFAEVRRRMVEQVNYEAGTNIMPPDLEALGGKDYFIRTKPGIRNRSRLVRLGVRIIG